MCTFSVNASVVGGIEHTLVVKKRPTTFSPTSFATVQQRLSATGFSFQTPDSILEDHGSLICCGYSCRKG